MPSLRPFFFKKNGFTMVEALITTALVAVIGMTVFGVLNKGITLWGAVHADLPQAEVAIFFEKCTQEFENVFVLEGATFEGNALGLRFPASLKHLRRPGSWSMGVLRYAYDKESRQLTRTAYTVSDLYQGREPAPEIIFTRVPEASFSYYLYDPQTKNYQWLEEWPPKGMTESLGAANASNVSDPSVISNTSQPSVPSTVYNTSLPFWPRAVKIHFLWETKKGEVLENERIFPIPLAQG